ncbi:MAG: hypothetical protein N2745_09540 [Syntrophorhabdaceae bacterium]|nr:hypothetical protein [Syntrophorhabdaceae bacterium]
MDYRIAIIDEVVVSLGIHSYIRNIHIRDTASPWEERISIDKRKNKFDVTLHIWRDRYLLYGRIYRQFLYLYDAFEPSFGYRPEITPDKEKEPEKKKRHDQIWSIYVDSRLEKGGIKNFYDRRLRKNIFIDSEKGFPWIKAGEIFDRLWERSKYSYSEIVDLAQNIEKVLEEPSLKEREGLNEELKHRFSVFALQDPLDMVSFRSLEEIERLSCFVPSLWKDIHIERTYYGIKFLYHKKVIMEIIPEKEDRVYITLYNAHDGTYSTDVIDEKLDKRRIEEGIKSAIGNISIDTGL